MTHKEIVEIAYRWVLKNGGMTIAFKELYSLANEIPDVIGFNHWESAVIECKVSRSDFLSDKKKQHRTKGMGNWRFYCCPKGMIKKEELPEKRRSRKLAPTNGRLKNTRKDFISVQNERMRIATRPITWKKGG
jgi:hypothetical protein